MGKANNEVVKDEHFENFRHLHIQWWVRVKKGTKNDRKLYQDYWVIKWKCNLADPKQWVDISSILSSFPTRSNITINNIIMISANYATKAKKTLM
jgi:hypothetical protein